MIPNILYAQMIDYDAAVEQQALYGGHLAYSPGRPYQPFLPAEPDRWFWFAPYFTVSSIVEHEAFRGRGVIVNPANAVLDVRARRLERTGYPGSVA